MKWRTSPGARVSPKFESLGRHELQRVRGPVKIDDVELHRRVGLASLEQKRREDKDVSATGPQKSTINREPWKSG